MSDIEQLIQKAIEANLDGLSVLVPFKQDQIKEIYNGIGPDSFPEWLRDIITSLNGLFEPAALIHDVDYYVGGTKEDFTAANDRFKENCYKLAKQKYAWYNPLRYIAMNKGRRWGNYCEIGGWKNFNQKESEDKKDSSNSNTAKYAGIIAMIFSVSLFSGCAAVKEYDWSGWWNFHKTVFEKLSSAFSKSEPESKATVTENTEK